jgi:hypothetical protein
VKRYWEIIADNLSKAGWSFGCVSAIDANGRTIWVADAHRDDGKRFVVHADEKLTAFIELDRQFVASPAALLFGFDAAVFPTPRGSEAGTARNRFDKSPVTHSVKNIFH